MIYPGDLIIMSKTTHAFSLCENNFTILDEGEQFLCIGYVLMQNYCKLFLLGQSGAFFTFVPLNLQVHPPSVGLSSAGDGT